MRSVRQLGSFKRALTIATMATTTVTVPAAATASSTHAMRVLALRQSQKTFPTGDPSFAVMQAFPAGVTAEEANPFLMCDLFGELARAVEATITQSMWLPPAWCALASEAVIYPHASRMNSYQARLV